MPFDHTDIEDNNGDRAENGAENNGPFIYRLSIA